MKLYIAGPMSGYPNMNFPEFHRVARWLHDMGFEVVNPAEKETKHGTHKPDPDKIPKAWGGNSDKTPAEVRKWDIEVLLECDGVVLLDGWIKSWGACLEAAVAQVCGMPLYEEPYSPNCRLTEIPSEWVIRARCGWLSGGHVDGSTDVLHQE